MPYPAYEQELQNLVVEGHLEELQDEPLVLAIYYASAADPAKDCLLEVAEHFGSDEVSRTHEMTRIDFGPTKEMPLGGNSLLLTLTNPKECLYAIKRKWPEILDIAAAIEQGNYKVLYRRESHNLGAEILAGLGAV